MTMVPGMWQRMTLISCVVFVWLAGAGCPGPHQANEAAEAVSGGQAAASRPLIRALWVWDAQVITDQARREELLAFCGEKGIVLIFADVGSTFAEPDVATGKVQAGTQDLAEFALKVHEAGMHVHALDGDASWSRLENHDLALRRLKRALAFNRARKTDLEKLDGFQFDIEPHTLQDMAVGSHEWQKILREYLELVDKLTEVASDTDPKFELGFAIPFWWDEENTQASELAWKGTTKPVAYHLIEALGSQQAPYIAIMAYRDRADGPDGSIAHSEHELAYADENGGNVRIYVGQETADLPDEPEKITFWQEGEGRLNEAVRQIEAALRSHQTFAGVAIHHYDSYQKLAHRPAEVAGPEQPLRITSPAEGDRAGRFTTVCGVAPAKRAGAKVKVSVLPEGDIWYEQGLGEVDDNGKWRVECHIGSARTPAGTKFTIKAEMSGEVVEVHVVKA